MCFTLPHLPKLTTSKCQHSKAGSWNLERQVALTIKGYGMLVSKYVRQAVLYVLN